MTMSDSANSSAAAGPAPIIRVVDLVKCYGERTILSGVNLDVHVGETMVIMGGSGSGKSTSLRLMIGSMRPDRGSIEMFGRDICALNESQLNDVRKQFGILFQSGALFNSMTIAENVALPLQEHTRLDQDIIDIQVKIKLELVGLREHADLLPSQISGGMKKRAGLARALALDPKVLFYDEPSAGLDTPSRRDLVRDIHALAQSDTVTVLWATHLVDEVDAADRIVMLAKGRVVAAGSPSDLIEQSGGEDLTDAYSRLTA